jgi:hypothetical protein
MKRLAMSVLAGGLLFIVPLFTAGTAFAASSSMTKATATATKATKAKVTKATKAKVTKATKAKVTKASKPKVTKTSKPKVTKTVATRTVVTHVIPAVWVMVRGAVILVPVLISALIGLSIIL